MLQTPSARRVHRLPQLARPPLSGARVAPDLRQLQNPHPAVKQWLAAHPHFHLYFTPTGGSWLNPVERWFALITDQAICCGSFESVRRLERAIMRWLAHSNEQAQPFRWTKSAARIRRSIRMPHLYTRRETSVVCH